MIIRNLQKDDVKGVEDIYTLYWSDPEFRERLSNRLMIAVDNTPESIERKYRYFVAEDSGNVVGIIGFRKVPGHMIEFAKTENPAEIYILAVRNRGGGIGKALVEKALNEIRDAEYTEVVVYSSDSHKETWGFYDHLGFERVCLALAPNGEPGQIWRMIM